MAGVESLFRREYTVPWISIQVLLFLRTPPDTDRASNHVMPTNSSPLIHPPSLHLPHPLSGCGCERHQSTPEAIRHDKFIIHQCVELIWSSACESIIGWFNTELNIFRPVSKIPIRTELIGRSLKSELHSLVTPVSRHVEHTCMRVVAYPTPRVVAGHVANQTI